ncbi:YdcF family protein [Piscinibacter aquaticus]|uniref:YdcF family protein n=1 Tax=Piscinibacter aquaticus TaxID=392597 RepID=A0A5C6U1H2_9BURK|nr:YdcF family protein [Piscinibacter aquaticus]
MRAGDRRGPAGLAPARAPRAAGVRRLGLRRHDTRIHPPDGQRSRIPLPACRPGLGAAGTDIVLLASGSVERHEGRAVPRLDTPAWERTAAAASLWQHTRGRLLVLGGPVMDGVSPARAMAEAAVAMGVPREAVTADDRGDTTITAFQLAPRPPADAPPWLVTSALHLPRAMLAARQAGWPVRAFPCDYTVTDSPGWRQWMPSTLAYRRNVELVHEYVGSLAYRWKER